ncbi:MAG: hypothetical protein AB7N53_19790 [Candidatus Binatia bacterium]
MSAETSVPIASLEHHVACGELSALGAHGVLELRTSPGLGKLEPTSATSAPLEREETRRHLHARYAA